MDPDRFRALESAFEAAQALHGEARDAWLAARDAEDAPLARELRALLHADAAIGPLDRLAPRLASVRVVLGPDAPLALPERVGPYVVAGEIGRGGMGVVCRAHDPRLGRDVALKIFPHASGDAERRVLAEARAASALDHPHICTIHDVGTLDDGRPYLAMAYYPGGTLASRVAAGPLPVRDAAAIGVQLAEALACAHAAGIVHRDVKPHNVAFGERGEAKLLDFGVALLRDQRHAGTSGGTTAYMAPEQVRGDDVDGRADVWALGVVLFELLAGRRPFVGADRAAVLGAIVRDDAADVRTQRPEVPPPLAAVVARALRREAAERWPDAGAMATARRANAEAPAHALLARAYTVSTFEGRARAGQAQWLDSAVVHAGHASRLAPRSPDGWSALGVAYAALGRHADAVAQLRRAVDLDARHASAMMDLARSYTALGRYEEAVGWMERAVATDPALPGGHARAVQRYRFFDLPGEARRHVELGMRARPTETYLRWESVLLALLVGDTTDARRQLGEYLPLVPPPDQPRWRALFELQLGDARAARPWVDRAVSTGWAAGDLRAYGIAYALTGDRARGDSLLGVELARLRAESRDRRALRRAAIFDVALLDLARVHAALGARDSALAALARWDSAGGIIAWRAALREPGWASVRDDPRFHALVARSDARFQRARGRLAGELASLRRAGMLAR